MKITITGATGFVGRHLINRYLKGSGNRLQCVLASFDKSYPIAGSGCEVMRADIENRPLFFDAVGQETDVIIHLAGVLTESRWASFEKVNVEGARNVADAALRAHAKKIIFMSAVGASRDAKSRNHRTKWEAEQIIKASGVSYTILRPTVIFGQGDRFTELFAGEIARYPVIPVPGNGKNRVQPVFVDDLAQAVAQAMTRTDTNDKVYEIGGPEVYTFDEMIDRVEEAVGRRRPKLHVPAGLLYLYGLFSERLYSSPWFTRDLLLMLREDYVTAVNALEPVFRIKPTGFAEGMRGYLERRPEEKKAA